MGKQQITKEESETMGRPRVSESEHFLEVGKTPNGKRSLVKCRFCLSAQPAEAVDTITGRPENYRTHLNKCGYYRAAVFEQTGEMPPEREIRATNSTRSAPRAQTGPSPQPAAGDWSIADVAKFYGLLSAFQSRHGLPDSFLECEDTIELFEFLAPGISSRLPQRKTA